MGALGELGVVRDAVAILREHLEEQVACVLVTDPQIPAVPWTVPSPDFDRDVVISKSFDVRLRSNGLQIYLDDVDEFEQFVPVNGPIRQDVVLVVRWWLGGRHVDAQDERRMVAARALRWALEKHWPAEQTSNSWIARKKISYGDTMREDSGESPAQSGRRPAESVDYAQVKCTVRQRVSTA